MIRYASIAGFAALALLAPIGVAPARAQTVLIGEQGVSKSEGLGRAFETFSVFGGIPGIAAARYNSDFSLTSYQLPVAHTFETIDSIGVAPYAEITLGYLNADSTFGLDSGPAGPTSLKLSFHTVSALAGAGIEIPLAQGFKLRPVLLAGYAHVGSDASFAGPNAAFVTNAVRGILDQAAINTALLGGGLELIYERKFQGDLAMTARARYNELAAIVTSASDPSLKQNGSFGIATGGVAFSGPTDWRITNHALRWIGYTNGTWLPDTDRSTLGFNAFAEIGGGLQLIAPNVVQGVRGGTVRASAIVGPGVTGWLVSATLDF